MDGRKYFVQVSDDSMSPEFLPGDHLVIDPDRIPEPGKFVLAGLAIIRRLSEDGATLEPLNPKFSPIPAAAFEIMGVVCQMNREVTP